MKAKEKFESALAQAVQFNHNDMSYGQLLGDYGEILIENDNFSEALVKFE